MNSFIIIGGAGYVGIRLVNTLLGQGCEKVIIVSRNTSKKILFRDPRVHIVKNIDQIDIKAIVVNLAFANTSDYSKIKRSTTALVNSIKDYHKRVGAYFIIHVSTVVLSEGNMAYGSVSKKTAYIYSKSLQENLFVSSFQKNELAIVRSGNILSEHSPWLLKIASKLINEEPLKYNGAMAPSNATSLEFLVHRIIELGNNCVSGYFNCCELSEYSWDIFIDFVAQKMSVLKIQEFDKSITNSQSVLQLFKKNVIQFGVALNTSPWHGDDINQVIGWKWIPISRENIRRSAKFKPISNTPIDMKTGKDFKLFCSSRQVESSFLASYSLEDFENQLNNGLIEMGFIIDEELQNK